MGMPAVDLTRRWTREEVLALPDDGNRYELVDGDLLVTPSPVRLHQRASGELYSVVKGYVRAHRLGEVLYSPADLEFAPGEILQPDVFVAPPVAGRVGKTWSDVGVPLLVIEVLSPSHPEYDREQKRRRYQKAGVPTYWIVDLDERRVEVWTPRADRPAMIAETLTWRPAPAVPAFELDLPALFAAILDA
jgi:Uma2 family endonuclease